jgi:hypothetical protein
MTPFATYVSAVLAFIVLGLLLVLAIRGRRRGERRMENIAAKLAKFDSLEVAQLADRWEQCANSIDVSRKDIMDAFGRIGLSDMKGIVDDICASVQDLPCRPEQVELQGLVSTITKEALNFRISSMLAEMEDFAGDIPHLHALRAVWQYQQVVDMYYQVISEVQPGLAEQLESMV